MCFAQFKIFNLATEELSVLENKGRTACARTALLVSALSQRNGCAPASVSEQEIAAELGNVKIGAHSAGFGDFAVSLPVGCPLLPKN
jgi:hypothetical protein